MSSVGQAVGGIVGGVIGFFVGGGPQGALYGAQLGMMVGGYIDPPPGPVINGPRLSDLNVQTSTYGAFIPRNYGTIAQHGNVFWVLGDALTETPKTTESGGKGGPTATTNTWEYSATFAVGLCQGPIDGIRRIWIAGQLWYDAGSDDLATIIASNQKSGLFTLYRGTDTQTADPTMQADKGAANVPAYRGLAYIVFNNLPLANYGNSLMTAQVKCEIVKTAALTITETTSDTGTALYWSGVRYAQNRFVGVSYYNTSGMSLDGENWILGTLPVNKQWQKPAFDGSNWITVCNDTTGAVSVDGVTWTSITMPAAAFSQVAASDGVFIAMTSLGNLYRSDDAGVTWTQVAAFGGLNWLHLIYTGSLWVAVSDSGVTKVSTDGYTWSTGSVTAATYMGLAWNGSIFCLAQASGITQYSSDGLTWTAGGNPGAGVADLCAVNGYFVTAGTVLSGVNISTDCVTWTKILATTAQQWFCCDGDAGVMMAMAYSWNDAAAYSIKNAGELETLGAIVEAECLNSGLLESADIDVTELTDSVRGYRVSSLGAIRGALDPLRAAWPFDVVQHGYQIKFKRRGSASVATIDASELDARAAGEAPGVQITDLREMDIMLPRRVSLSYVDTVREYDTNMQPAERINTDAVSDRAVELPIVFNADEAAQKAETLLYLYWLERYDIAFRLPPTYAQLEPGDVISLTSDAADYEVRLTRTHTLPDGRIECAGKYNAAAIYTSTAVGEEGQSTGAALTLAGPAVYALLDVPLMRDDDDTAGFPVAMTGYLDGWPGGILYRTDDAGETWTDVQAFAPGAVIGVVSNTTSSSNSTLYDFSQNIRVKLYSGSLASVTEAQLFAGQNWFAYGIDGRWEIIAVRSATLLSDGTYYLRDILHGQYGTEWAGTLHAVGDLLVLLDTAALEFISVNSSSIGSARTYRGITLGQPLTSDADRSFTYNAVNLEPLSPINLTGSRHPSTNDWTLLWTRRTRFAEWRDYVDAQLGEATESYEVDVFSSGTYATLKRTLTSATSTVPYTSAQQVTDFGSNQSTLYLKIYQLSATVGRGYPLTTSITRT